MSSNQNLMEQNETSNADCLQRLVGQRVEITTGAWKGEQGKVVALIPTNGCYRVKLDSGFQTAWGAGELRTLPNDQAETQRVEANKQPTTKET